MSKKVSIGSKPASREFADKWVSSRQAPSGAPVPTKRLTIDIPSELHSRVKVQCAKDGMKMADVIREMLRKRFGDSS